MNARTHGKKESKSYFWILEILLIATIVPALVAGILAIERLPIA